MKKLVLSAAIVVCLIALVIGIFFFSLGFSTRTDVLLSDFSYNSANEILTVNTTIAGSMGFIRKANVRQSGEKVYVSFNSTFGLNNDFGAKNSFDIKIPPECSEVYFEHGSSTYSLVLKKDASGSWVKAE